MAKFANKMGALLYCLWGLLHIAGGLSIMLASDAATQIAMQASARSASEFESISSQAIVGILNYHAFNLVWFGLFSIFVALFFIWRNLQLGYWLNFLVLGCVEFGLVTFMLIPGYMKWADGTIGLGLFFGALFLTTMGLVGQIQIKPRIEPKPSRS